MTINFEIFTNKFPNAAWFSRQHRRSSFVWSCRQRTKVSTLQIKAYTVECKDEIKKQKSTQKSCNHRCKTWKIWLLNFDICRLIFCFSLLYLPLHAYRTTQRMHIERLNIFHTTNKMFHRICCIAQSAYIFFCDFTSYFISPLIQWSHSIMALFAVAAVNRRRLLVVENHACDDFVPPWTILLNQCSQLRQAGLLFW